MKSMVACVLFAVPYLVVSFFLLFTTSNVANVVDAAHPRRRVTIRREGAAYDREITTFSEDGRLPQVEYGLEASLRGSTVGAIKASLLLPTTNEDYSRGEKNDDTTTTSATPRSLSSCIVVCIENSSFGKMHRIDDHIWMLTAGLAGDARMLANQARRACQNHRLQYGEAPTTEQAARITADFYHQLTRMGGCRPLGCTSILMGVDDSKHARLFRTDPGGGIEECLFCAAGNSQDAVGKELMALVASFDASTDSTVEACENDGENERRRFGSIARIATTMAEKVLRLLDRDGKSTKGKHPEGTTLDVWTIRPMKHRRGGMLATCYSDVRKDNVNDIVSKDI
jgi:20S proteasome alpha/beta subunit